MHSGLGDACSDQRFLRAALNEIKPCNITSIVDACDTVLDSIQYHDSSGAVYIKMQQPVKDRVPTCDVL